MQVKCCYLAGKEGKLNWTLHIPVLTGSWAALRGHNEKPSVLLWLDLPNLHLVLSGTTWDLRDCTNTQTPAAEAMNHFHEPFLTKVLKSLAAGTATVYKTMTIADTHNPFSTLLHKQTQKIHVVDRCFWMKLEKRKYFFMTCIWIKCGVKCLLVCQLKRLSVTTDYHVVYIQTAATFFLNWLCIVLLNILSLFYSSSSFIFLSEVQFIKDSSLL